MNNGDSLLGHIEALRKTVLEILAIFVILLVPGWLYAGNVLELLQQAAGNIAREHHRELFELRYFSLMEPFMAELKAGMLLAVAGGMPLYFWRFWHFLAPALFVNEKRWFFWGGVAAWGLFAAGAALGLLGVLPLLVRFSLTFAREGLVPMIGLGNFLDLAMTIVLAFGVMFELPLLLLIMVAAGVISLKTLQRQRPLVVTVILFLAALLTPPDVISQLMLGVPTYILFELMLLAGKFITRRRPTEAAVAKEHTELEVTQSENDENTADDFSDHTADADDFIPSCYHRRYRRRHRPVHRKTKINKSGYNSL